MFDKEEALLHQRKECKRGALTKKGALSLIKSGLLLHQRKDRSFDF
jgi:hypothetical protein